MNNYSPLSINGPILIIEDDADDRYIFDQVFKELEIASRVKYFINAVNAMTFLKEDPTQPFIIICDINLPIMNGLEFKKEIDQDEHLRAKSIPFVFFSTSIEKKTVEEAYRKLTIQGYFQKSSDYEELKRRLYSILDYWQHCQHPNQ
ncbi:response regulator [Xanthocytophaga agilis]|uniref:Response regulator n=1 Tax=Xanthocytophaga agilis TaxID=3048010 RepID=A0AAE3R610_9BACT|nr:response regulator [Xanthocytophaga agilis]MDJ1502114.1 response regulator [Xanthocytophaga agilis]